MTEVSWRERYYSKLRQNMRFCKRLDEAEDERDALAEKVRVLREALEYIRECAMRPGSRALFDCGFIATKALLEAGEEKA